jgi:hypothetical protein
MRGLLDWNNSFSSVKRESPADLKKELNMLISNVQITEEICFCFSLYEKLKKNFSKRILQKKQNFYW